MTYMDTTMHGWRIPSGVVTDMGASTIHPFPTYPCAVATSTHLYISYPTSTPNGVDSVSGKTYKCTMNYTTGVPSYDSVAGEGCAHMVSDGTYLWGIDGTTLRRITISDLSMTTVTLPGNCIQHVCVHGGYVWVVGKYVDVYPQSQPLYKINATTLVVTTLNPLWNMKRMLTVVGVGSYIWFGTSSYSGTYRVDRMHITTGVISTFSLSINLGSTANVFVPGDTAGTVSLFSMDQPDLSYNVYAYTINTSTGTATANGSLGNVAYMAGDINDVLMPTLCMGNNGSFYATCRSVNQQQIDVNKLQGLLVGNSNSLYRANTRSMLPDSADMLGSPAPETSPVTGKITTGFKSKLVAGETSGILLARDDITNRLPLPYVTVGVGEGMSSGNEVNLTGDALDRVSLCKYSGTLIVVGSSFSTTQNAYTIRVITMTIPSSGADAACKPLMVGGESTGAVE